MLAEVKQDESFGVTNFAERQLKYTSRANSSFLVTLVYKDLSAAICAHDMARLKTLIEIKLNLYGMSLRDLPFQQSLQSVVLLIGGDKYIPPLELAASTRNFLAFAYLLDAMFAAIHAKPNMILRPVEKNLVQRQTSARAAEFTRYLSDLREAAEDNEIYELVDILDNFEEDKEIAAITTDGPSADFNKVYWESLNLGGGGNVKKNNNVSNTNKTNQTTTNQMNNTSTAAGNGPSVTTRLKANLSIYHSEMSNARRKSSVMISSDLDMYNSKMSSKLCAIL